MPVSGVGADPVHAAFRNGILGCQMSAESDPALYAVLHNGRFRKHRLCRSMHIDANCVHDTNHLERKPGKERTDRRKCACEEDDIQAQA